MHPNNFCHLTFLVVFLLATGSGTLTGGPFLSPDANVLLQGHEVVDVAVGGADCGNQGAMLAVAVAAPKPGIWLFREQSDGFGGAPDHIIELDDLPRGVLVGDFHQDGVADVAVTTRNQLTLYSGGKGYGTGENEKRRFYNTNQRGQRGLHAAHLQPGSKGIDFFVGPVVRHWDGSRRMRNNYVRGPETNNNGRVALADLDTNGFTDAVFGVRDENKLRIYHGPFPQRQIEPHLMGGFVELKAPHTDMVPLVGDMDDDGRLDIVAAGRDPDSGLYGIYIWFQNSPIGFSNMSAPDHVISGGTAPLSVRLADINNNGLIDIIVLERERRGARLRVIPQPPDGDWPDTLAEASQTIALNLTASDIWALEGPDAGSPDIAVAGTHPSQLLIFRNAARHP